MLYFISNYLQLLVAEYLCEININVSICLMFIYTSAALKKSLKKKKIEVEKEIKEVFKHARDCGKKAGK